MRWTKLANVFLLSTFCLSLNFDVPIYFNIAPHLRDFLLPKTQNLVNTKLSTKQLPIDYTITLLSKCPSNIRDIITIELAFAYNESFYISPFGKNVVIYQTDYLIANEKMPEMIARVIMEELLVCEIKHLGNGYKDDRGLILTSGKYDVNVQIRADDYYGWEYDVFTWLFQGVLNFIQGYLYLDVHMKYQIGPRFDFEEIESEAWQDELLLLVYLSKTEPDARFIIPREACVQVINLNKLEHEKQIEIIEVLTGQLFSILGFDLFKLPKSPFIRLDFMIRKQLYQNYIKLPLAQQEELSRIVNMYDYETALSKSWSLINDVF